MDIKATLNNLLIPYTSNYAGTLLPGIREYTVTPGEKTTTISGKGKAGLKQEENYYFFIFLSVIKGITGKILCLLQHFPVKEFIFTGFGRRKLFL